MSELISAYDRLIDALVALAGLLMAAVCLLIIWDVVARNIGLRPPQSTVALTEYALLYITMAAAPALVRSRGHITIELLHRHVTGAARRRLDRAILAICACISLAVAGFALALGLEAIARGELDVRSFDVPRAFLFAPLAIGFLLMAVELLRLLSRGESVSRPTGATGAV
jgi:TRAP-type C4-dicarboxylate transport system permease small subunit